MRKKFYFVIVLSIISLSACGKQKIDNTSVSGADDQYVEKNSESDFEKDIKNVESEENEKGDNSIFETEYKIEDYCGGDFIVSKSDGLLYGVLNMQGEEIIPVEYDEIYFINKEEVVESNNLDVWIHVKYEDTADIYNKDGKKVFDSDVHTIDYEMGELDENSAYFISSGDIQNVYNIKGEELFSVDKYQYVSGTNGKVTLIWITPNMYLLCAFDIDDETFQGKYVGTYLYNIGGDLIYQWDGSMISGNSSIIDNDKFSAYITSDDKTYQQVIISLDGSITNGETISDNEMRVKTANGLMQSYTDYENSVDQYYLGENNEYIIYTSNDTWKYEDLQGNPVYDKRYYTMSKINNLYLLSNEDNEVCAILQNGKKIIDYGYIEYTGSGYEYNGMALTESNIFADNNSLCCVFDDGDIYQVYFWE